MTKPKRWVEAEARYEARRKANPTGAVRLRDVLPEPDAPAPPRGDWGPLLYGGRLAAASPRWPLYGGGTLVWPEGSLGAALEAADAAEATPVRRRRRPTPASEAFAPVDPVPVEVASRVRAPSPVEPGRRRVRLAED
jgi:hypothetical protein